MLDSILIKRSTALKTRVGVKSALMVGFIALSVALPQLVHVAFGASGGVKFLPMYLPVLIAGCLLGVKWGLAVGVFSPILSFLLTSAFGNPMPALERLPYMIVELSVFAAVSGMFSKRIAENVWISFAAVLFAEVAGRLTFLLISFIFTSISPISASLVWSQIQTGMIGLFLQAILVPLVIMLISLIFNGEKKNG